MSTDASTIDDPHAHPAVVCVRCGYLLHDLQPDAICPECGLAVARSLKLGEALAESRPGWLRALHAASLLLLIVHTVPLVGSLFLAAIQFAIDESNAQAIACGTVVLALMHYAAAWLLTRPENPHARRNPDRWLSLRLRICAIGPIIASAGFCAITFSHNRAYEALLFALALYVPCPRDEFILLRRIGRRVGDPALAEHSVIVGYGYSLTIAGAMALGVMAHLAPRAAGDPDTLWVVLGVLTSLLLFWLWASFLLVFFVRFFALAVRQAQRQWSIADASRVPAALS